MQLTSDLLFSPRKMKKKISRTIREVFFRVDRALVCLTYEVNFRIFFSTIQTFRVYDGIQICSWVNVIYEN